MTPGSLRLIFMGTPEFAVPALAALVEAGHSIVAVYSQPPRPSGRGQKETPSPIHKFALAHNLPVYTPATLRDAETQDIFHEHKADAAIVAAYGLLLPGQILKVTPLGCINVHPSLLPRWRGAAPIQRTIMAGDRETGIVIMQMDAGLDTGDMLLVKRFPVPDGMNAGALHDMLAEMAGPMVVETLQNIKNITPVKQPEEGITYAHKITKEEYRINWNEPANTIYNKIRGLAPSPGASFMYKGETIKMLDASLVTTPSTQKPGTTLDNDLTIACGEGALKALRLQRPGKSPMPAEDMLKGYPISAGERLQ